MNMEDFTVVVLSNDHLLHDNIVENYQTFKSAQNLSKSAYDEVSFGYIDSSMNSWLEDLSKYTKIDILILDDSNLQNFLNNLLPIIDSKVSKLVNLSNFHISIKEINLPKPLSLFELLEIIDSICNADVMFRSLSSGWIYCSNTARLQRSGDIIKLTDKESNLIEYLLGVSGYRSSKRELLEKLWNYSPNTETSTLETHLYKLRQKLPENMFIIDGNVCFLNV